MKRVHGQVLAFVLALVMMIPMFAKAEGYQTYKKGEMENFYISKSDKTGRSLMILEDSGEDAEYVKYWENADINSMSELNRLTDAELKTYIKLENKMGLR